MLFEKSRSPFGLFFLIKTFVKPRIFLLAVCLSASRGFLAPGEQKPHLAKGEGKKASSVLDLFHVLFSSFQVSLIYGHRCQTSSSYCLASLEDFFFFFLFLFIRKTNSAATPCGGRNFPQRRTKPKRKKKRSSPTSVKNKRIHEHRKRHSGEVFWRREDFLTGVMRKPYIDVIFPPSLLPLFPPVPLFMASMKPCAWKTPKTLDWNRSDLVFNFFPTCLSCQYR